MATVLLYNFGQSKRGSKIRFALLKMGVPCREVLPAEYAHPIGYLAGLAGFEPAEPYSGAGFADEMLVMSGFSRTQLDLFLASMRRLRLPPVALKAMVTEYNAGWDSIRLHDELAREHAAMRGLRTAQAADAAVHRPPDKTPQ